MHGAQPGTPDPDDPGPGQGPPRDHDRGLVFDLGTLLQRRQAIKYLAGAGAVVLVGCGANGDSDGDSNAANNDPPSSPDPEATGSDTGAIPEETAGPYPADGSNGVNVLTESGVVRSDIRTSFAGSDGVAEGVPLTITLTVTDAETGDPIPGCAVYLWHCDRAGQYSLYSQAVRDENYLRGVQETDDQGNVTFVSIFPACYSGRWPHIHFEVYPSLADATAAGTPLATSQLAFRQDVCDTVYATSGYEQSVRNMTRVSLDADMVFADGYDQQLAITTGDVSRGYTASLAVSV